jgi:hypothetical protein
MTPNYHQPDLPLSVPAPPAATDIAILLAALDRAGWRLSSQLAEATGLSPRRIRACAEHSHGRVISCTSRGYHRTDQAPPADLAHSLADLESRARKLLSRRLATHRVWHQSPHRPSQ